ncbi:dTMP kinase [Legionella jordanis]|uniref:Thymidylate kinase n=2 Tax=Legionella jordanis TaxID=456 RepID=A0A0W0V7M3_9GAMM|nr:thymidylate kinase [Legionella jordanis]RMX04704.1 dTMP kinase [Legionella jordanis]RMX18413.1 dTMP kinase [Legionella jordanis]VEH12477.1 dTMP kinase [Legionella jordanis]
MMRQGRFIVVEGLEGAGKSTAVQTIKEYLENCLPQVIITREPGGTRIGETVRSLIKEKVDHEIIDPRVELLLLYSARVQLLEELIKPALNQGTWVLGDRFELSTYAYQGGGRHLDLEMISTLSRYCLQGFKPDLIFFLDIAPELGLSRAKKRSAADRIEQESLAFFTDVANAYHKMISHMDNVVCIDAGLPLEQVQESIVEHLKLFIAKNAVF